MTEHDSTVVREILLDQYMAVEAAHLRNGEDTDGTEAAARYRQNLALGHIGTEQVVGGGLETIEGDVTGLNVALNGAVGEFPRQIPGHDPLEVEVRGHQLGGAGIAAVEAHKGIRELVIELSFNALVVHILWHGVVDVQQGYRILGNAGADVLGQGAVDIHLAGNRNAAAGETGVHIAGHKVELGLEGGPAFSGNGDILPIALVGLDPIQQGDFVLRELRQHGTVLAHTGTEFGGHFGSYGLDALVAVVLLVALEEIQLGIFLDFHAQIVKLLDGRIAGEEI